MMICRCPGCGTPFRVTPQQIKVRNGLVRCGECKVVFNALDQLVEGQESRPAHATQQAPLANVTAILGRAAHNDDPRDLAAHLAPLQAAQPSAAQQRNDAKTRDAEAASPEQPTEDTAGSVAEGAPISAQPAPDVRPSTATAEEESSPTRPASGSRSAAKPTKRADPAGQEPAPPVARPVPEPDSSTDTEPSVDDTRDAAVAAGLVAPRELRTAPGYSRWAETALSTNSGPKLGGSARGLGWLYGSLGVVLGLALAAQAVHHYRTEVATRWPASRPWLEQACAHLGCTVALPRKADLISIEASDLHSDPDRGGLLVLQATLRNRAAFAQALPALELTITDTEDRAVARRVLLPDEYLDKPASDPGAKQSDGTEADTKLAGVFAANGEIDLRLWIDARDVGAAGYRLYLFYP